MRVPFCLGHLQVDQVELRKLDFFSSKILNWFPFFGFSFSVSPSTFISSNTITSFVVFTLS